MPLTLLLSGALLPAGLPASAIADLNAALRAPVLARWLQRATVLSHRATGTLPAHDAWLAGQVFGAPDRPAPLAPYAWTELGGEPLGTTTVWFADPVHVVIGRDSLIIQPLPVPPTDEESDALITAANEALVDGAAGLRRRGAQWFLHTATPWSLRPVPLDAMLGTPFSLPAADDPADARRWARLHNAVQMNWHQHPVNTGREAHGTPPVNALWLHGGGRWAALPALRWSRVYSDGPGLRGAARAAGATASNAAGAWADDALVDLPQALPAARIGDWSAWLSAMAELDRELARATAAQSIARSIELVLTAHDRVRTWRVDASDRLRFWRRNDLAAALSVAEA